jgi:hypothetical protein
MKTTLQLYLIVLVSICCSRASVAQSLNDIKIGHCTSVTAFNAATAANDINNTIASERRLGLVMDARPFAINQSTGKLLFTRGDGRVSVVHMNPFVYDYKISVAQQELVSTALSDFLKLLLPPNLASAVGTQSGEANKAVVAAAPSRLRLIEGRIPVFPACAAGNDPCLATAEMYNIFSQIKAKVHPASASVSPLFATLDNSMIPAKGGGVLGSTNSLFVSFTTDLTNLRNQQFQVYDTCTSAQQLNQTLNSYDFNQFFSDLNTAQNEISQITALAEDLFQLATAFSNDNALKDHGSRLCKGFDCTAQFLAYATEVKTVLGDTGYQRKLGDLRQKGHEMQNMFLFTEQLRNKEGMFARTFTISKKFELSQATISIKREKLEPTDNASGAGSQSGTVNTGSVSVGGGGTGSGGGSEGTIGNKFGGPAVPGQLQTGITTTPATRASNSGDKPAAAPALAADVNEVVQLGRPRFMLSGGMVFSPLPRRTFKAVKGFVLDSQGNPTGNGDATVIGFDQNSPRRLFPMLFLNSRVLDYERGSLFFSLGITGKHDDNIDLEYLIGPSVSFLNDRALFTFGAYGGLTQNLVSDVKIGDAVPDSLGDAKFFRKSLTWKPGISFSYSFSRTKKAEAKGSSGGTGSAADDLRNEIRIGSVPFSLALGLTVTSLEQRTYDEIAGFARDRQGNLSNGQPLTRIVGVTSSSGYRMVPMAMLHTRLTNFGRRDFYFTSGLTGKKTDDDFDLEYLLGGSVNVYRRKVFLTFGTFIGKQQVLGGNFFEGAALNKTQNVTTINRYVWKPAVSFSYDISRIIPRSN